MGPLYVKDIYYKSSNDDMHKAVDTGRKFNVHKTFRRRPGRLLNVLCTFNLRPVSTGKAYIVIFTCATSRSIILDLVEDNSSKTFTSSIKNIIAKRGCPKKIISDNGSV